MSVFHKHISVEIDYQLFHLFSRQRDHVQRSVHEATNQSLGSVLGGNDIIHPVVGRDVLQFTTRTSITQKRLLQHNTHFRLPLTFCSGINLHIMSPLLGINFCIQTLASLMQTAHEFNRPYALHSHLCDFQPQQAAVCLEFRWSALKNVMFYVIYCI